MDVLMTCGEQETIALLALALHALDVPAVSRTGWQVEILTEEFIQNPEFGRLNVEILKTT